MPDHLILVFLLTSLLYLRATAGLVTQKVCQNEPGDNETWESVKLGFPTVESIKKDIQLCGNMPGATAVFWSYGANQAQCYKFIKQGLKDDERGITFSTCLGNNWGKAIEDKFRILNSEQRSWVMDRLMSQAFAELVTSADAYILASDGYNALSQPKKDGKDDDYAAWYHYELPQLQLQGKVMKIITVNSQDFSTDTTWTREEGKPFVPPKNADDLEVPPLPPARGLLPGSGSVLCQRADDDIDYDSDGEGGKISANDPVCAPFPTSEDSPSTVSASSTVGSSTINAFTGTPSAVSSGTAVGTKGSKLRILCVGDSITAGFRSDSAGAKDGNGYRRELQKDLASNDIVFAGTQQAVGGTMDDGYFAAWDGQTISSIAAKVGPSLAQQPNIILLMAGTNDMNPNPQISQQGTGAQGAANRLGSLIDQMVQKCPNATILVAQIIPTCDSKSTQQINTNAYNALIPGIVQQRSDAGHKVMSVDLSSLAPSLIHSDDCVHPTNQGYIVLGDWWFSYLHDIPEGWITFPEGPNPNRTTADANGGPDPAIPPPNFGASPVKPSSASAVQSAANAAKSGGLDAVCNTNPTWFATGQIALGLGHDGNFTFHQNWVNANQVATGLHLDPALVHLADIDGDGKADYLALDPESGKLTAWLNKLPAPWVPAGTDPTKGLIADGAGAGKTVFFADVNGDKLADYLVVNDNSGEVTVYWNAGPDPSAEHGWRWNPGGVIATGVPHSNLKTLRFADVNGDGRADYVIVGEGGSLGLWLNTGPSIGSYNVTFLAQGGIATGATSDVDSLVLADVNGDGRADYLVWDHEGGLSGFLNIRTQVEGVPFFAEQHGAKSIAKGVGISSSNLRLADLDGDGKVDYCIIDPNSGAVSLWWNRGRADTSVAMDGLRFADIDGDGWDDYIWLDPVTGAPYVYINGGPHSAAPLGWAWNPLNGGTQPIALGAAPASQVQFADIDGDGLADYLALDPVTGALSVWINGFSNDQVVDEWTWSPIGQIATGLGPGANRNIRFADIDGDGKADYIYVDDTGAAIVYRNTYAPSSSAPDWQNMTQAAATGIGQRPEEISFYDINGDGLADYIWTNAIDGSVRVWLNNYNKTGPFWQSVNSVETSGVGTSGQCVRWAYLQGTGRASYVAVNPDNGAIAAWMNGCTNVSPTKPDHPRPTGPGPTTYVEFGNSSVLVGNLTGPDLYTSVSSALDAACPTPTGAPMTDPCKNAKIKGIKVVEGGLLEEGELDISLPITHYSTPEQRQALIIMASLAMNSSATGKNCKNERFAPTNVKARDPFSILQCSASADLIANHFAQVHYEGLDAWLQMETKFKGGSDFLCELALDVLKIAIDIAQPELAPETNLIIGTVESCCKGSCAEGLIDAGQSLLGG